MIFSKRTGAGWRMFPVFVLVVAASVFFVLWLRDFPDAAAPFEQGAAKSVEALAERTQTEAIAREARQARRAGGPHGPLKLSPSHPIGTVERGSGGGSGPSQERESLVSRIYAAPIAPGARRRHRFASHWSPESMPTPSTWGDGSGVCRAANFSSG